MVKVPCSPTACWAHSCSPAGVVSYAEAGFWLRLWLQLLGLLHGWMARLGTGGASRHLHPAVKKDWLVCIPFLGIRYVPCETDPQRDGNVPNPCSVHPKSPPEFNSRLVPGGAPVAAGTLQFIPILCRWQKVLHWSQQVAEGSPGHSASVDSNYTHRVGNRITFSWLEKRHFCFLWFICTVPTLKLSPGWLILEIHYITFPFDAVYWKQLLSPANKSFIPTTVMNLIDIYKQEKKTFKIYQAFCTAFQHFLCFSSLSVLQAINLCSLQRLKLNFIYFLAFTAAGCTRRCILLCYCRPARAYLPAGSTYFCSNTGSP